MTFADAISECGLIAILRGITTAEVDGVGQALVEAGIRVAEIPLNSPDPFASIEKMAAAFKGKLVVSAGTVLCVQDVNLLKAHGGQISVSPDCNEAVIARASTVSAGRTLAVARCDVYCLGEGRETLVAAAQGTITRVERGDQK